MKPEEILNLIKEPWPFVRVKVSSDVFPSGLAIAMVPAIVDWQRSSIGPGDDNYFIVRNVNFGGNPVSGHTTLTTVRVPCTGVVAAEYVEVCGRILGRDAVAEHGQIRLVFAKNRRPVVLDQNGEPFSNNPYLDDLVFSYEAWRPPTTEFDPRLGLNPKTYALTLRCYGGCQRFLEDGLRDKFWACYPLQLPDVPEALDDLLYTCLTFGDSLARHTVRFLLRHPDHHFARNPSDYAEPDQELVRQLRTKLAADQVPENSIAEITGGEISYHLLLRSCITMALTTIDAGADRTHQRYPVLGERPHLQIGPESLPSWVADIAFADKLHTLLRIPALIYWVAKHQEVFPSSGATSLDRASLLRRGEDGSPVRYQYSLGADTPYGQLRNNLMY
jgi:hypothetical protein